MLILFHTPFCPQCLLICMLHYKEISLATGEEGWMAAVVGVGMLLIWIAFNSLSEECIETVRDWGSVLSLWLGTWVWTGKGRIHVNHSRIISGDLVQMGSEWPGVGNCAVSYDGESGAGVCRVRGRGIIYWWVPTGALCCTRGFCGWSHSYSICFAFYYFGF